MLTRPSGPAGRAGRARYHRRMASRDTTSDLLVVGAGIVGLACAWEAARRGLRVTLLERGKLPGRGNPATASARAATWASAGMLAPLAEIPEPGAFFELCRHARDLWQAWAAELKAGSGVDFEYDRSGALLIGDDGDPSSYLAGMRAAAEAAGEPWEWLEGAAASERVPALALGARALFLAAEHRVDNREVACALVAVLELAGVAMIEDAGVERVRAGVDGVEVEGPGGRHRASRLLLAAGAWAGGVAGLPALPVHPVRGQMMLLGDVDLDFRGSLRGHHFYAVPRRGRRLLVGATVETAGFAPSPTPLGLASIAGWLEAFLPAWADKPVVEAWAGLRPASPDGLPIVGQLDDRIWVAGAHYRNGILLAPWTARHLAARLAGDALSSLDQEAAALFSPARWPASSTNGVDEGSGPVHEVDILPPPT
jgi:glycine oxidase